VLINSGLRGRFGRYGFAGGKDAEARATRDYGARVTTGARAFQMLFQGRGELRRGGARGLQAGPLRRRAKPPATSLLFFFMGSLCPDRGSDLGSQASIYARGIEWAEGVGWASLVSWRVPRSRGSPVNYACIYALIHWCLTGPGGNKHSETASLIIEFHLSCRKN
jgi:hypothetical protein